MLGLNKHTVLEIKRQPGDITHPFLFLLSHSFALPPSFLPSLHPRPLPPLYKENMENSSDGKQVKADSNKLLNLLAGRTCLVVTHNYKNPTVLLPGEAGENKPTIEK